MAIDLDKIVYGKIDDGEHQLSVNNWELKVAKNEEEYVELSAYLDGTQRLVKVALFERSLDITLSNVAAHLELGELSAGEILAEMVGKELPAYHETVHQDGNTYYNWYICNRPRQQAETVDTETDIEVDLELPAF